MKGLKSYLLLLFVFFLIGKGHTQNLFPPITNYTSTTYGTEFAPENYGICQDKDGIMYFGNTGHILTFDGSQWRAIPTVPTRACHALYYAKDERIYVGVKGDFGYLATDSVGRYSYTSLVDSNLRENAPFNEVWKIFEINDGIVFHSEQQIFLLKNDRIILLDMAATAHTVFNVDGELVARFRGIGLMVWENETWKKVKGSSPFELYGVFGIENTFRDSIKLVISQEIGVFKWNIIQNKISPLSTKYDEQLNDYLIFGTQSTAHQNIILHTKGNGLVLIDQNGKTIERIDERAGLVANDINQQFIDVDGNLWVTTANGISLINLNARLSYFSTQQGLHGGVNAIFHEKINNKEYLFIGTNEGLFKLNEENQSLARIFEKVEEIKYAVWDIDFYHNTLFISTSQGLFTLALNNIASSIKTINRINVNATLVDENHQQIITAGARGVYIYDLRNLQLLFSLPAELTTVTGIQKEIQNDTTVYWMGVHGQGVLKITYGENYSSSFFNGVELGLSSDHILVPQKLNNKIAFGSTTGLLYPDETTMDGEMYTFFMPHPIGDSNIQQALFHIDEDASNIWYCLNNNVGVYDKKEKTFTNRPFWGIKKGRINTLQKSDIAPYLWIGASDGLIRYAINGEIPFKKDFKAAIRSVHDKNGNWLYGGHKNKQENLNKIAIDYEKNYLKIQFSAPYFEDHQPLEYSYLLKGYNQDWTRWHHKNEIEFSNLPDGTYTFKVKARNVYHQLSETDSISFTILTPWYKTIGAFIAYIIILILIIYIAIKIGSYRLKQQNKRLEMAVQERTKEIAEKNTRLENQKSEILTQKKEIDDSINYAQRIQNAILPIKEEMLSGLGDSFILFWPKDVVSGDFYWYYRKEDLSVVVCADCTGHGVPGAFMSMIGIDKLNVCVGEKNIMRPDKILAFLNAGIKTSLRQDESEKTTRDGMDAAIITINHRTKTVHYAGAYRSLWYIQNEELNEVKATKVAVGGFTPLDQEYELHELSLSSTTRFYMSSDGYADQFGGSKGKKFKIKKMKNLILKNHLLPMKEQQIILEKAMQDWSKKEEQIDDICVIGISIEV